MSNSNTHQLPVETASAFNGQATIEMGKEIIQKFSNGRVLTFRPFEMTTIRGFTADLVDDTHRLLPRCFLMNQIDDEDRLSVKIKLAFGKIPKQGLWGQVSSSILMRSYAISTPEWREDDYYWQKDRDHGARDKIIMRSNTESLVLEPLSLGSSFKIQNLVGDVSEIPDEIWNPCLKFSIAAAKTIRQGEFPDFSELNDLEPLTQKTYHATERLMAFQGELKPSEM